MKAKAYYIKYQPELLTCTTNESAFDVAKKIYIEFAEEVEAICRDKNIQLKASFEAVIQQQNQKWNALVRILESNNYYILKRNGFSELTNSILYES